MKKFILATLSLLLTGSTVTGQRPVIKLSFTSRNSSAYVTTDSIRVENISKACDTILYFPDTVLILDELTGIEPTVPRSSGEIILMQNHPNPFSGQTFFEIFLAVEQNISLKVCNAGGKILTDFKASLPSGLNSFIFRGGSESFYILQVSAGSFSRSMKMFINPGKSGSPPVSIIYNGPVNRDVPSGKFLKSSGVFTYTQGDTLRYVGFARTVYGINGSSVIMDSPDQDTLYQFGITEGLPCPGIPSVVYYNKIYTTRQIGTQCWMRENLDAGIRIDGGTNQSNNDTIEKYCYNNDPANCTVYGGLYQWYEAMQYSSQQGIQGICPPGWHLPTDAELTALCDFLGGENSAGGHLKERGLAHWMPPNTAADNSSGFCALPAGMYFDNHFEHFRYNVEYWSSTNSYGPYAWYRILYNNNGQFLRTNWYNKLTSRSVRCMKNE